MDIKVGMASGDYAYIQEAIDSVPFDETAVIAVGEGIFHEKLFSEKTDLTIIGAGIDKTVIEFGDYANDIMEDGSKRGTFRSYTAFFGGKRVAVKNLTIRNAAGDGRLVGQAIALYADADICFFENVKLVGCQDTLFCAPLPMTERQKNGFRGPREFDERKLTKQYYKNCEISGDIDFIFGGADAVFDDCTVICNNRESAEYDRMQRNADVKVERVKEAATELSGRFINGYITAACGLSENTGFIFRNCTIKGAEGCSKGSVFLGRPWREQAKTVFLECVMDESIAPERFSGWGGVDKDETETYYGEYGTRLENGKRSDLSNKNKWVKNIDDETSKALNEKADEIVAAASTV